MRVGDLVSAPLHTISPDKSVRYAAEMMNELKIGSLVVMEAGVTVGIVTSRDVRNSHPNRIVADAMSRDPKSVASDVFIWNAWDVLKEHGIERLLVHEGERTIGLVTRELLNAKLSELRDPLTGMYRSAYIRMIGEDLLARRIPFELLFIDLDNFGEINKIYGHPVGDDVIVAFAHALNQLLADSGEYVSRYAGDEFVWITTHGRQRAADLMEQLQRVRTLSGVEVTATVGVVGLRDVPGFFAQSFRDLIAQASLAGSRIKNRMDAVKNPPPGPN